MNDLSLPWPDDAERIWRDSCRLPGEDDWPTTCTRLAAGAGIDGLRLLLQRRAVIVGPATGDVHLNLLGCVLDPFEPGARFDDEALATAAAATVRFAVHRHRGEGGGGQTAVGLLGLADALAMLGHRYDAWTARGVAAGVAGTVAAAAADTPVKLASGHDELASGLAGHASCGGEPLSATAPSFALSLWQYRYGQQERPSALAGAFDPPQAAREAMRRSITRAMAATAAG
ncbi:MAG: hypothetical protein FJ197_11320 [Gammaproteobacteria bacterium]|nr:hypothetical protein [Gammaproteobacteria bacterium]